MKSVKFQQSEIFDVLEFDNVLTVCHSPYMPHTISYI